MGRTLVVIPKAHPGDNPLPNISPKQTIINAYLKSVLEKGP